MSSAAAKAEQPAEPVASRIVWRATGADAQRTIVVGTTGSGKTTFAAQLAAQTSRCIWVDVKGLNDPGWSTISAADVLEAGERAGDKAAYLAQQLESWPHVVAQLADRPDLKDEDQVDALAAAAYTLGNVLFVLDDAMGVLETRPPYFLNRILTMGRSRGVGFMPIVQRVHRIPRVFLTEAEHIVAFQAFGEDDIERLERDGWPGLSAVRELERWGYIWYDREAGTAQRFKPLISTR